MKYGPESNDYFNNRLIGYKKDVLFSSLYSNIWLERPLHNEINVKVFWKKY